MSYLLDTNVVSEWVKPRPDPGVIAWLAEADEDRVCLSVITLAEIRHGIDCLADGDRRRRLDVWLRDELPQRFEGRILDIDSRTADAWGRLMASRQAAGRPMSVMDGFIAATANVHGLTLITRNQKHFSAAVGKIINPWSDL